MKVKTTRARKPLAALKKRLKRTHPGSEEELKALARSWLENPIHDILVRASDLAIGDGNRRAMGLELIGETEADVTLLEGDVSDRDLDRMAMVSAFHRSPLGGYDQACIVRDMRDAQPGMTNKDLADEMHIDGSMPTRLLALFDDCIPAVQEAAKAGKIGVTKWYSISQSADQMAALQASLNGSSRAELERARILGSEPEELVTKIRYPLSSGVVVTVSGDGIAGLAGGIDALGEAIRAMRSARKGKKTVKEAQAMWKQAIAKDKEQAAGEDSQSVPAAAATAS